MLLLITLNTVNRSHNCQPTKVPILLLTMLGPNVDCGQIC